MQPPIYLLSALLSVSLLSSVFSQTAAQRGPQHRASCLGFTPQMGGGVIWGGWDTLNCETYQHRLLTGALKPPDRQKVRFFRNHNSQGLGRDGGKDLSVQRNFEEHKKGSADMVASQKTSWIDRKERGPKSYRYYPLSYIFEAGQTPPVRHASPVETRFAMKVILPLATTAVADGGFGLEFESGKLAQEFIDFHDAITKQGKEADVLKKLAEKYKAANRLKPDTPDVTLVKHATRNPKRAEFLAILRLADFILTDPEAMTFLDSYEGRGLIDRAELAVINSVGINLKDREGNLVPVLPNFSAVQQQQLKDLMASYLASFRKDKAAQDGALSLVMQRPKLEDQVARANTILAETKASLGPSVNKAKEILGKVSAKQRRLTEIKGLMADNSLTPDDRTLLRSEGQKAAAELKTLLPHTGRAKSIVEQAEQKTLSMEKALKEVRLKLDRIDVTEVVIRGDASLSDFLKFSPVNAMERRAEFGGLSFLEKTMQTLRRDRLKARLKLP